MAITSILCGMSTTKATNEAALSWVYTSKSSPVVVLLGWMQAQPSSLRKFAALYADLGANVLIFRPSTLSIWFPKLALGNAVKVLDALLGEMKAGKELRPIMFVNYSGSPKSVYYKVLQVG